MLRRPDSLFCLPVLLAFALSACGSDKPGAPAAEAPARVSVAVVSQMAMPAAIEAAGTAALRKEIPLGFTSPGRIARILVQEGDYVRRGQVLAVLDTTTVGAAFAGASAEQTRARAELERYRTLYAQGWVTKARLEAVEAAARNADASVTQRRFTLDTARIVAPASGIILARGAEPGQNADVGTPVVTLGDSSSGYVLRTLIADRDAVRLRPGMGAQVRFEALPSAVLAGQVIEVGGRSERASGAFIAEIALPPDPRLRSGLVGKASIAAPPAEGSSLIVIPPSALFAVRAEEGFVYVLGRDRKARARKVALGPLRPEGSEVLSGLATGEMIVTSNLDRLRDGISVEPVRAAP